MRLGPKALLALAFAIAILPAMSETEKRTDDGQPTHENAVPPIDCPLHAQGVDMNHLKPFEDVEKYIAFLERPDREAWLSRLYSETKPGARLVLVEFAEGDLPQGPPEAMKIPKDTMIRLVSNAGFVLTGDRSDLLPYQNFMVFSRP